MDQINLSSKAEQVQSIVERITQKLIDLPQECQEQILPDLERIRLGLLDISKTAGRGLQEADWRNAQVEGILPAEETQSGQAVSKERLQAAQPGHPVQPGAELQGKERDSQLYHLNRSLKGFVYDWDLASNLVNRSEGIEQILGCDSCQVASYGEGWKQWMHPDDAARVDLMIRDAIRQGKVGFDLKYRVRHTDGDWIEIWDKAWVSRDANGVAKSVRGIILDISRLSRMEQNNYYTSRATTRANIELRRRAEQLRVALSNAPIAVFQTDLDFRFNWFYSPVLGLTSEQFLGKRDDELFPPASAAEMLALKQEVVDTRKAVRREIVVPLKNGPRVWIITAEPLYDFRQRLVGIIGSCVDVTRERQLETRQVEQTFQLEVDHHLIEHQEQACQKIAHNLHEGPIQSLSGLGFSVELARQLFPSPEVTNVLDQIGDQVKDLVSELREATYELRPAGLARFGISKAIQYHAEEFMQKHPDLKVHLSLSKTGDQLPEKVSLAFYRIYQESMNNIVRHAQAREAWVALNVDSRQVTMEIKDNGKGFPAHSDWVKHARQGHFGLVVMKDRAESVGAKVRVKSELGYGTTVRVVLQQEALNK